MNVHSYFQADMLMEDCCAIAVVSKMSAMIRSLRKRCPPEGSCSPILTCSCKFHSFLVETVLEMVLQVPQSSCCCQSRNSQCCFQDCSSPAKAERSADAGRRRTHHKQHQLLRIPGQQKELKRQASLHALLHIYGIRPDFPILGSDLHI